MRDVVDTMCRGGGISVMIDLRREEGRFRLKKEMIYQNGINIHLKSPFL